MNIEENSNKTKDSNKVTAHSPGEYRAEVNGPRPASLKRTPKDHNQLAPLQLKQENDRLKSELA